ncbi:hypothetical protein ABT362_39840 [Nonomuraea rubra]|uniref:hypothetical protein n=1 Tax=Nonomuraea rubra TaxID=46180 RepID=UPI00161D3C37
MLALVLVGLSAVPLVLWRRSPFGVFAAAAAASVVLSALDYRSVLMLGPVAALYVLTASRERQSPWTWRSTAWSVAWASLTWARVWPPVTFPGSPCL